MCVGVDVDKVRHNLSHKPLVYSYRRSGTNLLCAYLYVNFYDGVDMWSVADSNPLKIFYDDEGQPHVRNKWSDLFGSHDSFPASDEGEGSIERAMYIKRDRDATARSLYRFSRVIGEIEKDYEYEDWLESRDILSAIDSHHETAESLGLYTVDFEDLVRRPYTALESIANRFNLAPVRPKLRLIRTRVGWNPSRS